MAETMGITLSELDLNLLVALDAILREGSVSGAAHALSISQPAVSHKLGRLRMILGDPLLVRHGRGLVPTPRARELAAPLAVALQQLGDVLAPSEDFDPAAVAGVIRLASKYAGVSFLPTLVDELAISAPGLDLHILQMGGQEPQGDLAEGRSDIVIQPYLSDKVTSLSRGQTRKLAQSLYSQRLYPDPWVVLLREGHALCDVPMSPETFANTNQILVSLRGDPYGFVDSSLEAMGLKRRIALLVQSFMLGCVEVARTDMIMTTNLSIAMAMQELLPLCILPMPIDLPNGCVSQVWHQRTHADPMHAWTRRTIFECGQRIEKRVTGKAEELGIALT